MTTRTEKAAWNVADYASIAELVDDVPPRDLLARAQVGDGHAVLDVGAGTGNIAVRAAAAGALVVGLDPTAELFEAGRRRAQEAGQIVGWVDRAADDLFWDDNRFDRVLSAFGVQFAPRPESVARQLARVCRVGGRIGLVSWTPTGQVGELFAILDESTPMQWGDEDRVRELFEDTGVELEFARGHNPWLFASVDDYVAFVESSWAPVVRARERLEAEGHWEECRAQLAAMARRRNQASDGSLLIYAEYLVAIGKKTDVVNAPRLTV